MRVLFVCGADLDGPSEKQALGFAERLAERGHEPVLALRGAGGNASVTRRGVTVAGWGLRGRRLTGSIQDLARHRPPDLVHAWSPRLRVLSAARALAAGAGSPLLVHFEDDEWSLSQAAGRPPLRRALLDVARAVAPLVPGRWPYATTASLDWVARQATSLDAITPALAEAVESRLGRDCRVVLPVLPALPPSPEPAVRPAGAVPRLLYTGNVFGPHLDDLRVLFAALGLLQTRGLQLELDLAGDVAKRFDLEAIAAAEGMAPGSLKLLGQLPFARMPELLAAADLLVQPGRPTEFNRLRLPSKLQSYLPSGTPTVTFGVGFGELLVHGEEALTTQTGTPEELAEAVERVLGDGELAARLAAGGRRAAARLFDADRNTDGLLEHYAAALADSTARS